MENLPLYIPFVFIITTIVAALLLYKASHNSKPLLIALIFWLVLQAFISLTGFYVVSTGTPPRFAILLIPPVVFIAMLFITKPGRSFMNTFDPKTLTLLHVVRIPVEITLYWLFLHNAIPQIMTFEGRNFDILCGLTAPVVYYLSYVRKVFGQKVLLGWNILCLLLLANIVVMAVLSAPFSFQKLAFEQPNIALFYFPFIWLPAFIVPAALFAHLVSIRKIISKAF